MPSNHIGSWQGNIALNVGPWQGIGAGEPPLVITDPLSQTIEVGETVYFSVSATGTAPLNYQWYKNGILQIGETSTTYSFVTTLSNDGDTVYCNVTNLIDSVDSGTASLSVYEVIPLTGLDYYTREQPTKSEELVNRVVVTTQPLIVATATEELFKMSDVFTFNDTETRDFIKRLSPVAWTHINLHGQYEFFDLDDYIDLDSILLSIKVQSQYAKQEVNEFSILHQN